MGKKNRGLHIQCNIVQQNKKQTRGKCNDMYKFQKYYA